MSRLGRKPVALPSGVTVEVHPSAGSGDVIHVTGPKGNLTFGVLPDITIAVEGSIVTVGRKNDEKKTRAAHGLTRALLQNMTVGVSQGFSKQLEIIGVGYKVQVTGKSLVLQLGYSHPVPFALPAGIEAVLDEKNKNLLTIRGIDRQLVGQVSAEIRGLRPPEPYKGKGIRYTTEHVRRKAGKAAVAKAAA